MSHTIATLLTGRGRGAVASIAIEGSSAETLIHKHFESAISNSSFRQDRIYFGTWHWQNYREDLVICRTDEHRFEIHCHGGKLAAQYILQSLTDSGAQSVSPGEWIRRLPSNRFVQEARNQLPNAKTERAVAILLDQTRNAMTKALTRVQEQITVQPKEAIQQLETMLSFADLGTNLTRPFSVTLIGPPNAGKSSLVNAILGFERAIVYDQPGTTRDIVSAETALDGWPVSLSDTAGIRKSEDPIERAGMDIAKQKSESADLILLIRDLSSNSDSVDLEILKKIKRISVGTKSDLLSNDADAQMDVITSSTTGRGIDVLCDRIVTELVPTLPAPGQAVPISQWQVEQLEHLLASVS